MEIDLVMKVAGGGMIVAVSCHILKSCGKEDYSGLVSLAGVVIVLLLLAERIGGLFSLLRQTFGV
ncbi:MAG: stage III sporulation protein AC [Clostridia bacterium]|nr:stage III sporulation protein AC [Clostridia bacterium]